MLDGALTAFQGLQHPFLKRRQLGSGLVHRGSRTLFSGIHKPLCLVLRFKSHGLQSVLHQKLHTQLDAVRKSIQLARPELEELPEQPSDPTGVAASGLINCHVKTDEQTRPDGTSGAADTQPDLVSQISGWPAKKNTNSKNNINEREG